jgi:orotidine-5'-phosphate decarboxylase
MSSASRLIVALDLHSPIEALTLVQKLPRVEFYKIGLSMLTSGGFALANELKDHGKKVFLDLKLFDIGQTIENAVSGLMQANMDFMTVHGDPHVIRAAVKARGNHQTKILAVTFLTSLDRSDLDNMLIQTGELADLVVERARLAFNAGADGVIASPQEAMLIRRLPESQKKLIVTPGVRPHDAEKGDQKRTATPAEAILAGADHIVVGRPIIHAENPADVAESILADIAAACGAKAGHA